MSTRLPFTALPVLLCLAACGGSPSSSSTTPTEPAAAKSSLPRTQASAVSKVDLSAAVTANNAFAVDLYAHVRQTAKPGNLFTSPLSASLALSMTYAGAKGQTATEMASALHLGASPSHVLAGQNALDQTLESRAAAAFALDTQTAKNNQEPAPSASDYDLHVVNSVWGEQTYPWAQPFLDVLASDYGTGVFLEDFEHQFDQARQSINGWVSTQTKDKINDLLPSGALDDTTRMVLVNAVHLKLPWATPFQVSETKNATFTRADGSQVTVPMMNQGFEGVGYVDDGKAQIITLPLAGGDESVLVALPHGDLASYEAELAVGSAALTPQSGGNGAVELSLPKVSFTSATFSLAKALQAMGMKQAFDAGAADLTGLCEKTPDGARLHVSDVLQKAMLGMQENGVEAAAATAVLVSAGAAPGKPVSMVVDRPFLVSIVDATGAVLFLGHIEDPSQSGE